MPPTSTGWQAQAFWKRMVLFALLLTLVALGTFGIQTAIIAARHPVSRLAIGKQLLEQQRPLEAALVFENPEWQAVAHYQAARYRHAAEIYQSLGSSEATYNYGVSVARLRRWDDAIAAFRVVLDEHPDHEDAQFNYALLQQIAPQQQAWQRSNDGADQGGELQEDQKAAGDSDSGSARRAENEAITPEPTEVSEAAPEQDDDTDPSRSTSGENSAEESRRPMEKPPIEAGNQSLANLGDTKAGPDDAPQDNTDEAVQTESAQSEEAALTEAMKMRKLSDNASVVLKARLRELARIRETARQ